MDRNEAKEDKLPRSLGGIPCYLLRRSCLYLLGSITTLWEHLPAAIARRVEKEHLAPRFEKSTLLLSSSPEFGYNDVLDLLLAAIAMEVEAFNQQIALWQLCSALQVTHTIWSRETLPAGRKPVISTAIGAICGEITSRQS